MRVRAARLSHVGVLACPQARIKQIKEEQQRQEAARRARGEYEARLAAEDRKREEAEQRRRDELRKQEMIKEKSHIRKYKSVEESFLVISTKFFFFFTM